MGGGKNGGKVPQAERKKKSPTGLQNTFYHVRTMRGGLETRKGGLKKSGRKERESS